MFNKNFSKEPTEKQKVGEVGENYACKYLEEAGYRIVARNYSKKWGEIDIVAEKAKALHFVEVKSVSRDISTTPTSRVIRETGIVNRVVAQVHAVLGGKGKGRGDVENYGDENVSLPNNEMRHMSDYRPEDNMHPWKLKRLSRVIQSYLMHPDIPDDTDWQFDLITVYIDTAKGLHKIELLEDIVL